jgi:hypothetical protein
VRKRQAELFINRMTPLTPTFLKQGINFLDGHVFAKRNHPLMQFLTKEKWPF